MINSDDPGIPVRLGACFGDGRAAAVLEVAVGRNILGVGDGGACGVLGGAVVAEGDVGFPVGFGALL